MIATSPQHKGVVVDFLHFHSTHCAHCAYREHKGAVLSLRRVESGFSLSPTTPQRARDGRGRSRCATSRGHLADPHPDFDQEHDDHNLPDNLNQTQHAEEDAQDRKRVTAAKQTPVVGSPATSQRPSVSADIREAFIAATVEALLLDLREYPPVSPDTVGSPSGHQTGDAEVPPCTR